MVRALDPLNLTLIGLLRNMCSVQIQLQGSEGVAKARRRAAAAALRRREGLLGLCCIATLLALVVRHLSLPSSGDNSLNLSRQERDVLSDLAAPQPVPLPKPDQRGPSAQALPVKSGASDRGGRQPLGSTDPAAVYASRVLPRAPAHGSRLRSAASPR